MQKQYNLARRATYLQNPQHSKDSQPSALPQLGPTQNLAENTRVLAIEGPETPFAALKTEKAAESTGSARSWEEWGGWEEGEKYCPPPGYIAYEDDAETWPGEF